MNTLHVSAIHEGLPDSLALSLVRGLSGSERPATPDIEYLCYLIISAKIINRQ